MTPDRKKPGLAFWATVVVVVVLALPRERLSCSERARADCLHSTRNVRRAAPVSGNGSRSDEAVSAMQIDHQGAPPAATGESVPTSPITPPASLPDSDDH